MRKGMLVLLVVGLVPVLSARAQAPGVCSEEEVRKAVQVLETCGVRVDPYVAPQPCVEVVTRRFLVKDTSVLTNICQPGVSGRCLDALLDKFAPAQTDVDGGLKRLAEACRDVNPFCAVALINRYQVQPEQIRSTCPAR